MTKLIQLPSKLRPYYGMIFILFLLALFCRFFVGFHPINTISYYLSGTWIFSESSRYGFEIAYPAKWTSDQYIGGYKNNDEVIFVISNPFPYDSSFYGVWISRQEVDNPTPEDVAAWGESLLINRGEKLETRGERGYELINFEPATINGQLVFTRIYLIGGNLKSKDVYIAREHDMIILSLRTTPKHFDVLVRDFDRMVESFRSTK